MASSRSHYFIRGNCFVLFLIRQQLEKILTSPCVKGMKASQEKKKNTITQTREKGSLKCLITFGKISRLILQQTGIFCGFHLFSQVFVFLCSQWVFLLMFEK